MEFWTRETNGNLFSITPTYHWCVTQNDKKIFVSAQGYITRDAAIEAGRFYDHTYNAEKDEYLNK